MRSAEIRFKYDEAFARLATKRFLLRYARTLLFLLPVAAIIGIWFAIEGSFSLAVIMITLVLAAIASLMRYAGRAVKLSRRLGAPEIDVVADDGGISFRMNGNQSRSEWSQHRVIWRFDDVWLFFPYTVSNAYTGIPAAAMTPEFRDIVIDNINKHGGTLR